MKKNLKAFMAAALAAFLMAGLMAGCSGDDPQPDVPDSPQEKPEPEKPGDKPGAENPVPGDEVISAGDAGEMEYEIGKPAVVEGAGDLQMSISQTSSYTDPDGTVFTCEPEARINVSVRLDTVYAKDFNELIELLEYVKPTCSENGEDPVTHSIDQQFRFGDQTIDLDMDYEVYTYRNSLGQNIGMPYIELREADFGEGGGTSAGEIIRPSVTIRRVEPATRTIEVEDTAAYNVSVHFGVMAAPQNFTGAENKFERVEFEVQYVGMVPYTDTYPGAELSYRVEDGEGNALEGSEFTVAPGSSFMLNVVQNSSYTDQDGALSASPVAWTRITAPDTLSIDNAEELPALLDKVVIETGADELEGNLPYYRFETAVPDGEVSVAEVFRSGDGKTIVYKAAATYRQKAVPVNIDGAQELEFTYVVEYLGKVSVRLVDVTYDQDVIWEDAHHNIYTNSQCVVTRNARYSDGTVVESKFYSTKNFVQPVVTGTFKDTTGEIEDTNYGLTENVNSFINHLATGVPDLEHLSYETACGDSLHVYLPAYRGPVGVWTAYKHQDTNELYNESGKIEGWYGKQFGYRSNMYADYYIGKAIREYKIDLIYKDRFFCIDGRLFTFDPLEHKHSWSVETIETPNRGTCALHTLRADVTWLGRDFVYMVVDTVYVKQPSVATDAPASPSYPTRSGISSRSGSPYVDAPEYQQNEAGGLTLPTGVVPGSAPYTEHTVIRPDGTRTTIRREGIVPDISFDVPGKK